MNRVSASLWGLLTAAAIGLPGCWWSKTKDAGFENLELTDYDYAATTLSTPNVEPSEDYETALTPAPTTIDTESPAEYWDLSLQEAIHISLTNSKVLRDLGGTVLRSPASSRTVYDPAIQETDPRFGVAAALSAFDTTLATSAYFERNHRALNNTFFGGGTRLLNQDADVFQTQLTKRAATGTAFTIRNRTDFDANNAPGNAFPSVWNIQQELEFRHPVLQGGGVQFNRIAGPSGIPGLMNGVMLARVNTDASLADFEVSVRNFVSDVENAYWDLYFAYRDLDARIVARDAALETWRRIHALYTSGRRGGEAEKEALARQQYFQLQEDVQNSLSGRLVEGTRTFNGSSGGTFRATGGVFVAERRLRLAMRLPISDGRTLRPVDEPSMARVDFDWEVVMVEALTRRPELRKQKWLIKRREMELLATENFMLPQLDTIGRYRWRGLGQDLVPYNHSDSGTFNNALGNLVEGNFQEWQLGLEFSMPLGRRKAYAAVRNAELQLARERILLAEQEREVTHDLSNAVADKDRAFAVVETSYNRRLAAMEQLSSVQAAYDADNAPLNLVLDAQRNLADAESHYHRSLVEYMLAVKNVQFEKGTLLDYSEVYLSEGYWPVQAYQDAADRAALRSRPLRMDKVMKDTPIVNEGNFPQLTLPPGEPAAAIVPEPIPAVVPPQGVNGASNEDFPETDTRPVSAEVEESPAEPPPVPEIEFP